MKKIFFSFAILFVLSVSCDDEKSPTPVDNVDDCLTSSAAKIGDVIPGEYIVTTTSSSNGKMFSIQNILDRNNIHVTPSDVFQGVENYSVVKLSDSELENIKNDPSVSHIEPDRKISVCGCITVVSPRLVTWNVEKVGYEDGTGKTAWIMDTGIDLDHPDLTVDNARAKSFVDGVTSADDDNGHGTHVAGIIGAKNNTIGTLGVASGATLVPLKILDKDGNGRLSIALKALTYVRSVAAAGDAVNISLSLEVISETLESEIKAVANKGIYVVIAAGNEGKAADTFSPGRTSGTNIYTISAVDSLNNFAGFSNYGNDVIDYAAPGVRILSTYANGKYAIMSGTSMAAPHVTGILLVNNGKINTKDSAQNDPDGTPDPIAHR
jgi:subtilisin